MGDVWVAAESETFDQEPCTQPNSSTTTNNSAFNDTSRHIVDTILIRQWPAVIYIPHKLHFYQYNAVDKYCSLCAQMLDGANWHEARWKPGLFTFWLWSGHCTQCAFTGKVMIYKLSF